MEEAFEKLKKDGRNSVDLLMQWMKDGNKMYDKVGAKLFSDKAKEEAAKKCFEDIRDQANVEFAKFEEVVQKVAEENKSTIESLNRELMAHSEKLIHALRAGASAAAEELNKK